VSSHRPNRLLQGERLARQYSCFQCHGELGQGGFPNAGALKGYIPGYFGSDFALLTRGGHAASIRAWIRQGVDPALLERPIEGAAAEFFIKNQAVSMPKFESLPESEIRILTDYVIALNQFGEMDAKAIRAYSRLSQRPP
jgi:mono/diheme cytochrome c family protein